MRYLFIRTLLVCTLAPSLFFMTPTRGAITNSFSELPGAVFHDLPSTGSADPFGPSVAAPPAGSLALGDRVQHSPGPPSGDPAPRLTRRRRPDCRSRAGVSLRRDPPRIDPIRTSAGRSSSP